MQIPYIEHPNTLSARQAAVLLPTEGLHLQVAHVNWPEVHDYCPQTDVWLAHTGAYLYVLYRVNGEQPRATADKDGNQVCEDSCVEMFCQGAGDPHYINFEANCIGTIKASRRLGRKEDVAPLSAETLARIERHATLGREPFGQSDSKQEWMLCLRIPMDIIFGNREHMSIRANFYKCADKSLTPHFVTWNPITTERPDFHRPEFFRELLLETEK